MPSAFRIVFGHPLDREAAFGDRAGADTTVVERNDAVVLAQCLDLRSPGAADRANALDQEHGVAGSSARVAHPRTMGGQYRHGISSSDTPSSNPDRPPCAPRGRCRSPARFASRAGPRRPPATAANGAKNVKSGHASLGPRCRSLYGRRSAHRSEINALNIPVPLRTTPTPHGQHQHHRREDHQHREPLVDLPDLLHLPLQYERR